MEVFQKIIDRGTEKEKIAASPALLKTSFPQASEAEMIRLQAAMDSSKTVSDGMKAATKVRGEQRRVKKFKGFQDRAVTLLDKILDNPELEDVLGSYEGVDDNFFETYSDNESDAIADIKEAADIFTGDNLGIMSGVLSETDIKIIRNLAGGALERKRSEKRFKSGLIALRDKLKAQGVISADDAKAIREVKEGRTATGPKGEKIIFTNGKWVPQNVG